MALIKRTTINEQELSYWHLFQLNFDYPANEFIVKFNGYVSKASRSKEVDGEEGFAPRATVTHKISRASANAIATLIYGDAKENDLYSAATDDNTIFIPEERIELELEVKSPGFIRRTLSSIMGVFTSA